MARILSISYDKSLLSTRQLLLEGIGHEVTSAVGLERALKLCRSRKFDLVIIGHSIPEKDKEQIIRVVREVCETPVLALLRPSERPLKMANYNHELMHPEQFLSLVKTIVPEEASG
jgi:DNA-binding response OmpR family regulator